MTIYLKKKFLFIAGLIIITDQIVKFLIKSTLHLYEKIDIIKGFFQIKHIRNSGAVWGLFSKTPNSLIPKLITLFSIIALIIVVFYFLKIESSCILELTSLSFIMGGALGNLIDRITRGTVIDFLDFYIGKSHWPTFNVADFFITTGVLLLILSLWRGKCPSTSKN